MVFFTCNACGEAVKKNQVEKHYMFKCSNCTVLSCVDCGKDFPGDSYKTHIKCISEEQKYSGRDWKPKPNANKGEQRQEEWIQQVSAAIEKCAARPRLKELLLQIKEYPNIPRKKVKFENFLKNSLRVYNPVLVSEAWDLITAGVERSKPKESSKDEEQKERDYKMNGTTSEVAGDKRKVDGSGEEDSNKKKKKKDNEVKENKAESAKEDGVADEFSWKKHLVALLSEAPDNELSLKKVKKKLVKKLRAHQMFNETFTEEDFTRKFEKYINKKSKFTVDTDRIKLTQ